MSNLWDYVKNLFKSAEESSPSNPVIHELIDRTEEELKDYHNWKEQLVRRRLTDWLQDQYTLFRVDPDHIDEAVDFLDTPSSKGFAIHFYKTGYALHESRHFLDYLKEKVLELGYRTQISDTRTFHRNKQVVTIERHYLKPPPNYDRSVKLKQAFGNVRIELKLYDEKPHQLTFSATTYKDHLFEAPQEFEELMREIVME